MNDTKKTKLQLIAELQQLRQQVSELNNSKSENKSDSISITENDQRYRNIIEQSFDGFSLINDKGLIIEWNNAQERITGLSQKEVLGKFVWDIQIQLAPAELNKSKLLEQLKAGYYQALISNNDLYQDKIQEQQIYCPDGSGKTVQNVSFRIVNNEAVMIGTIMRDISARKQAERSLQESEERFRTMFETNHAIMLLLDPTTGKIEDANPAACSFYGYPHKKFVNEIFVQNINTLSEKQIKIEMRSALNEKRNYFIFKHKLANGVIRDVEVYSSKTIIKGKELLYSIIHDITERKIAEEASQVNEEKLRNIVENSTNLFYSHTVDHEITYISPQSREFLQCDPEDAKIRWTEFASDNPINDIGFALTEKAIKTGKSQPSYELELIGKKGKVIQVEVHEAPVVQNGKTIGIVGSLTNITMRKRVEERVARFDRIIENSLNEIYLFDADTFKFTQVNNAAQHNLGYTMEEIQKLTPVEIKPEYTTKSFEKLVAPLRNGKKEKIVFETVHKRKDQSLYSVEVHLQLLKHDHQALFAAIILDITDRKRADKEIKSLAKFPSENPNPVLRTDKKGQLLYANKATFSLLLDWKLKVGKTVPKVLNQLIQKTNEQNVITEDIFYGERFISVTASFSPGADYVNVYARDITERKMSEEALRKSEEQLRLITDNTTDNIAITTFDLKATYIYVNPSVKTVLGYEPEDLLGKSFFDFIHPDDKKALFPLLKKYVNQKVKKFLSGKNSAISETIEYRFKNKIGNWRFMQSTVNIAGKQLLAVTRDITERKQAEKALQESEEKLRNIVEHSTNLFYSHTSEHKITYISPQSREFLQCEPEEAMVNWTEFVTDNPVNEKGFALTEKAIKSGKRQPPYQLELVGKKGKIIRVEVHEAPVVQNSKTIGIIGSLTDITRRKHTEEALIESEERFSTITEQSTEGITVATHEGEYVFVNPAFCKMVGYSRNELLKMTVFDMKKDKSQEGRKGFIKSKKDGTRIEVELQRKDKSTFISEVTRKPIKIGDSDLVLGIVTDITERKQAEKTLQESEEQYRNVVENAGELIWQVDTEGKFLFFNKYTEKLSGAKSAEWQGKHYAPFVHPDDLANVNKIHEDTLAGNINQYETRIFNNKGEIVDLEIQTVPVYVEGKVTGTLSFGRDITERKQAEERYRDLVEKAGIAIVIDDLDGKFTYFNNRFAELFGYKENEISKKSIQKLVHPEDMPEVMIKHNSRLNGKSVPSRYEFRGVKKDGSVINLETDIVLLKEGNSFVGTRSYLWDISERKHSEETLREQSETIRSLVETSQDWIWSIDLQGQHTYSNPAVELILGYKSNELVGKPCFDIMHEKDRQTIEAEIPRWISEKQGWHNNVIRWKHKNGSWRYLESNAVPIIDAKGEIAGFRGVDRDITERIQMEKALHESEEKYRMIVENAHDGIEITQNDRIIFSNSCFAEMLGYTADELKNVTFSQFFTEQATQELYNRQKKRETNLPMPHQYETTFRKKDGTIIDIDIKYEIIDYNGKPATFAIIRDITERKQAEEEKVKLEKQLRRAQKLETIGTLAGGIAHDFNNILAPIMGYTDMALLNLENSDPLYSDLQHVLKGAHRAKDLVEQILLFSKQSEKERQPLALQAQVKEALKLLRPSIPTTIEIRQRIDDSCGKVQADATQIHQVIVNLCTNAWQSMEETGGTLTLELNQIKIDAYTAKLHPDLNEAEYARLSVIDTGPGMDEETLDRIFEPFFTTKAVDKGTGLGLSVVHGIVQSHKGDIHVYSENGKGSVFHVYLPILVTIEEKSKVTLSEITKGSESIMIVDDEMEIANLVKRMLENFGYKAEVFQSGIDGLKEFKQNPKKFDLLITDLTMPQMTGLDLADQIHKVHPQFPVLIMTGFGDNITSATQKRYGIKQVIGKPIIIQELTTSIRSVLGEK